jgi:hypothetical protein
MEREGGVPIRNHKLGYTQYLPKLGDALQGVFLESMYCCLSPAGASSIQGRREYPLQGIRRWSLTLRHPQK